MARWSSVGQTRITPRRRFSPWRTLASTEWSTTGWIRTGLTLPLLQREGKLQHPFLHQNWVCLKTQVGWPHIRLWLKWRVWRFCRFYVTRPSPIASRGLATETKGSKTTEQLELQWAAHVIKEMTCWYTTFRKNCIFVYLKITDSLGNHFMMSFSNWPCSVPYPWWESLVSLCWLRVVIAIGVIAMIVGCID